MNRGLDCATPLTAEAAAAFAADGATFVARYLVPGGWKALTRQEAELISAAGLQVVSVFETTADRALGGYEAGRTDGETALQVAAQVGQPAGSCIYFAVDFDAASAQMPAVIEYIRGAAEATPDYATGVYGSFAVVEAVRAAGVCSHYWQTYAWSRGQRSGGVNIYQYQNDIEQHGVRIDRNESDGNEGGWRVLPPVEAAPQALPAAIAANIIDSYLATAWQSCEQERMAAMQQGRDEDAAAWMRLRDWQHVLANELRRASGLAEQ